MHIKKVAHLRVKGNVAQRDDEHGDKGADFRDDRQGRDAREQEVRAPLARRLAHLVRQTLARDGAVARLLRDSVEVAALAIFRDIILVLDKGHDRGTERERRRVAGRG